MKNQAPLKPPSQVSLQSVREFLTSAYNKGEITDSNDEDIYLKNIDKDYYKKANKEDKQKILQILRELYNKFVYEPLSLELRKPIKEQKQKIKRRKES